MSNARPLKFQPRAANRRAQSERDALIQAEEQRIATRRTEAANVQRASRAGPQSRTRGGLPRRHDQVRLQQATGPLGSANARESSARRRREGAAPTSSNEANGTEACEIKVDTALVGLGQASSDRRSVATSSAKIKVKHEETANAHLNDLKSDQDTSGRLDIAHISLVESDDNDPIEIKGEIPRSQWHFRPVRVDRHDHVERQVGVNTDASSEVSARLRRRAQQRNARDEGLFVTDGDAHQILLKSSQAACHEKEPGTEAVWQGVWQEDAPLKDDTVKVERDGGIPNILHRKQKGKDHPRARPRSEHVSAEEGQVGLEQPASSSEGICNQYRDIVSIRQADESHDLQDHDFSRLMDIFYDFREASKTNTRRLTGKDRGSQAFVMQLPPLLPRLTPSGAGGNDGRSDQKQHGSNAEDTSSKPMSMAEETTSTPPAVLGAVSSVVDPFALSGEVGRLRFFKSGRITADWGGIQLDIKEEECSSRMAQEVVIMEESRTTVKVEHSDPPAFEESLQLGGPQGKVTALGPAIAGLVATLDWQSLHL